MLPMLITSTSFIMLKWWAENSSDVLQSLNFVNQYICSFFMILMIDLKNFRCQYCSRLTLNELHTNAGILIGYRFKSLWISLNVFWYFVWVMMHHKRNVIHMNAIGSPFRYMALSVICANAMLRPMKHCSNAKIRFLPVNDEKVILSVSTPLLLMTLRCTIHFWLLK